MAVTIQKEKIQIEYLVAQESMEKSLEFSISIPQHRPEMESILDLLGRVEEVEGTIVEDGVEISGSTSFTLIYKGLEEEGRGPFFIQEEGDFHLFFSIPKAQTGMDLLLDASILELKFAAQGDGDIEIFLVLEVRMKVLQKRLLSFITGVEGLEREATIDKERLHLEELLEEGREVVEQKEEIRVEGLEEILHYEARICRLHEEQEDGKVILSGEIEFSLIYGKGEDHRPFVLKEVFDFSRELNLLSSSSVGRLINLTELVRTEVNLVAPGNLKVLFFLEVLGKMVKRDSYQVITGIESKRIDVQRDILNVENVMDVNRTLNQATFNHNLPPEKGDLGEVLSIQPSLRECITEATSGGAKITGHLEVSILYHTKEGDEEERSVQLLSDSFVFEHFIPLSQAREGMLADTTLFIRGASGKILNDRTLEITATLDEMVRITSTKELMVITDLVVVSSLLEEETIPSMVLYVIQPQDTLWKISRRFGAKKEDILEDNKGRIEDPERLVPGEKIFVRRNLIGAHREE